MHLVVNLLGPFSLEQFLSLDFHDLGTSEDDKPVIL